ncbi:hypothetical protein EVAR_89633_1 [Eumeta japonica]|uniref:Uncharacterized protein n=1 Tax=Eumeta variegata TaxID=151549 RepID=A0A4C1Z9C8_EUMVA|nr:hypothetical protein EVAR_89633_1 [Eumeta japonica]
MTNVEREICRYTSCRVMCRDICRVVAGRLTAGGAARRRVGGGRTLAAPTHFPAHIKKDKHTPVAIFAIIHSITSISNAVVGRPLFLDRPRPPNPKTFKISSSLRSRREKIITPLSLSLSRIARHNTRRPVLSHTRGAARPPLALKGESADSRTLDEVARGAFGVRVTCVSLAAVTSRDVTGRAIS